MNFTKQIRENEEILTKLDRIHGFCSITRDNIDGMIVKYSSGAENYNEIKMKEDVKLISSNLDAIINFIDPIFKFYFVVPTTTENENVPSYLNPRKSDSLIKYENSLLEKLNQSEKRHTELASNNTGNLYNIEMNNSPHNITATTVSHRNISENNYNKAVDTMNVISKTLNEKLKKLVKDAPPDYKSKIQSEKKNIKELSGIFDITKKILNKK